jgi:hypothetical protein
MDTDLKGIGLSVFISVHLWQKVLAGLFRDMGGAVLLPEK